MSVNVPQPNTLVAAVGEQIQLQFMRESQDRRLSSILTADY